VAALFYMGYTSPLDPSVTDTGISARSSGTPGWNHTCCCQDVS